MIFLGLNALELNFVLGVYLTNTIIIFTVKENVEMSTFYATVTFIDVCFFLKKMVECVSRWLYREWNSYGSTVWIRHS